MVYVVLCGVCVVCVVLCGVCVVEIFCVSLCYLLYFLAGENKNFKVFFQNIPTEFFQQVYTQKIAVTVLHIFQ